MRIQMKNKAIAWRAEKRKWLGREKKKKKICFSSSAIKDIQQTPVTPTTFSSPKILYTKKHLKKIHFPKHLTCEEKGRVFFEYFMSITHDVISRMSHVPCTRVLVPWGRQKLRAQFEYKRAQVTNDGHHRRCLSTEQGTENGFSEVVRVLVVQVVQASYLDKEN